MRFQFRPRIEMGNRLIFAGEGSGQDSFFSSYRKRAGIIGAIGEDHFLSLLGVELDLHRNRECRPPGKDSLGKGHKGAFSIELQGIVAVFQFHPLGMGFRRSGGIIGFPQKWAPVPRFASSDFRRLGGETARS